LSQGAAFETLLTSVRAPNGGFRVADRPDGDAGDPPPAPRIHVDDAAQRTMRFLAGPRGVFAITDGDPV